MTRLRTSLVIIGHSLRVLARNPGLLVFAMISLVATLLLYFFFLVPMLFDMPVVDVWQLLRSEEKGWESVAPWRIPEATPGNLWLSASLPGMAAYFLLLMFATSFINVALYSQILEALSGRPVSVFRGFAVAGARLPAIAAWSMLAGTVGLVLRIVQERSGPLGKWVAGMAGISWTAASVFVIPVMINEPRCRSPLQYLRLSTALIRRVWGEGVIGLYGMTLVLVLFMVVLMVPTSAGFWSAGEEVRTQVAYVTALVAMVVSLALYLAWQIFECGLYVYATEGVAPGTFDEGTFDKAWSVKPGSAGKDGSPVVQGSRARFWLAMPAVIGSALLLLAQFAPKPVRLVHQGNPLASYAVNLAALDFALEYEDLQAAGMFTGQSCWSCDLSTGSGKFVTRMSEPDAGFQVSIFKQGPKGNLYVHFYGPDVATGKVKAARQMESLRALFPGRESAFVRQTIFVAEWGAVPGAATYTLEIQSVERSPLDTWLGEPGPDLRVVSGLKEPSFRLPWFGKTPGRWRVQAVDASGQPGALSEWADFSAVP